MRRRGWSGTPQGEGLVDVELVDGPAGHEAPEHGSPTGFEAPGPAGTGNGTGTADVAGAEPQHPDLAPPRGLRHRRTRWWVGVVAAAVVVAVVVGANVAEARRADARRTALAETHGYVPSLAEPLQETWHVQGSPTGETDDALLVSNELGTQAIDPTSGDVLWTYAGHPGAGQYCQTVGVPLDPLTGLPLKDRDAPAAPQLLACGTSLWAEGDFGPVTLEIIDASTGELRSTLTATGSMLGTVPVERDVVMLLVTAEGHLRVVRWDPTTGEAVFDETTPDAVVPAGTTPEGGWGLDDDTLTITADRQRQVVLSLETGLEVPDANGPTDEWTVRVPMPDGAEATWTYTATGISDSQVLEADGSVRFEFDGMLVWGLTTDRSAPEVMVTLNSAYTQTSGLDARTGRELWTLDTPNGSPLVQVDGVLVMLGPVETTAVDVRDGRTLWTAPATGLWVSGITDGEAVLVVEAADLEDATAGQALVARTIRDGSELWRSSLPRDATYLTVAPGGGVIGYDSEGVFGLG